ncbi:MAG: DotU family type IV/VI secretion system protein [Holosporales bacterium]|jgi:type VI secretion system protein ImpK|nr:DotU family type IV/VI secretion system protein [Holosporales bacterium]
MIFTDSPLNSAKLLENFFKDFYYELLKCKELALRTTRLDAELEQQNSKKPEEDVQKTDELTEKENTTSPANANQHPLFAHKIENVPVHAIKAADEIQERLKKVWGEQTSKIVHLLDQADSFQFKDAQYAMVSLADEVFLTLPWSGQQLWQKYLLESQIFKSQSAGTQVFQKMDDLLSKYDPSKRSLATVYLYVLALGFKGKLRDAQNQSEIKTYERRLYAFIHGKNPSIKEYGLNKLMPECYERTIVSDLPLRLPNVKFWTLVFVSIVLLFVFCSFAVWNQVAGGISRTLSHIFEQFQIFLVENN